MESEYSKFNSIASQWWDENGDFSILHKINPIRIRYILNQIEKTKKKHKSNKKYFQNIKIIDIGCGGGLVCEPLARLGAKVSGLDFVKKNIKIAKQHAYKENLNINYFISNIDKLKLRKKYDVILLLEVIEHLNCWEEIIKKVNGYLKPGGILIISSINRNLFSAIAAVFFAEKVLKWLPKGTHDYNKLVKPEELIDVLKKNNFIISNLCGMIFNPLKRNWFLSKKNTRINYFCTAQKIN